MGCRGIAVQVDAPGRLQHPVHLEHADRHHDEVGQHVVLAEEGPHGPDHLRGVGVAAGQDLVECLLGVGVPMPSVLESLDLGRGLLTRRRTEEHVVIRVGVEGWVEIDEVDAFVWNVRPHDLEVVAVVKVAPRQRQLEHV